VSQSIVIWVRVGGPHIVSGLASPVHIDGVCRWEFWFHNLAPGDYVIDVKVGGLRQPPMQTPPTPPPTSPHPTPSPDNAHIAQPLHVAPEKRPARGEPWGRTRSHISGGVAR
jgi:hypothetical protein